MKIIFSLSYVVLVLVQSPYKCMQDVPCSPCSEDFETIRIMSNGDWAVTISAAKMQGYVVLLQQTPLSWRTTAIPVPLGSACYLG